MTLRAPVVAVLAVLLASIAAGCSGESASAQKAWADIVCSSLVEWRDETRAAGDDLREALADRADHRDILREAGQRAADSTGEMLAQLGEVGAPPVDDDSDAAEAVARLEDSLRATRDDVTGWVELLAPARPEEVTGGLNLVAGELAGALAQLQTTVETLGMPGGELEDAFSEADSCRELESGSERE